MHYGAAASAKDVHVLHWEIEFSLLLGTEVGVRQREERAVYSFMTEINEESRYAGGESRQLRRNERDVLIVYG